MFDLRNYYKKRNEEIEDKYKKSLNKIKEIYRQTKDCDSKCKKNKYSIYFNKIAGFILELAELEDKIDHVYFQSTDFETLNKENNRLFSDIIPKNYEKSYANPTYCVNVFGKEIGQLLTTFYTKYRNYITYAFLHKKFMMEKWNKLFIDTFAYIHENEIEYEKLKELVTRISRTPELKDTQLRIRENLDEDYKPYINMLENADLNDMRYLFHYGKYITENQIKIAEFLQDYPEDKIKKIASQVAKAYVKGFEEEDKDLSAKSTVKVIYQVGQERIIRYLLKELKKLNLNPLINMVRTKDPNKQYRYDHRFDKALYLDQEFSDKMVKIYAKAMENLKDISGEISGTIFFDVFGEKPFKPVSKKENLKLSPEQQKLNRVHQSKIMQIQNKYIPRDETSFSIIAFPSPEIGTEFENIFEDILEVNMLETKEYEPIQQKIIDALDKADYVHVKGKGDSQTDIKVKMQKLEVPKKHTNFVNCGASVNIPLGEVFTSPQLEGTNGVLHVKETFLSGLKYVDLKLTFEDGFITEYSCNNFDNEKDNKEYIEENLLFPHKTLPIGEFAIGTNTLAYVVARKYDILDVLPVLIIEKMGPHFAIGDTCFTMSEDKPVFNDDGKEITARDNEKTIKRKTDPQKAYTFCHTDITLPYESLGYITAITADGEEIDIIRDERFVLPGTEDLNKPLNR